MNNNLGNKRTMARNIRHYMDLYDVSSKEMCEVLEIPQSTFSYWLHAKTYPRIDKIEKMANYFHIKKQDLIEEQEKPATDGDGLDEDMKEWIRIIRQLSPEKRQLLKDFLQGPER